MTPHSEDVETPSEPDGLKRVFGLPTLVIYGTGDILGAGIYALVGKVAGLSGAWAWASFMLAMLVAALTALSYAELGSRMPKSGGVAYFIHIAFQREWLSMLVGWLMFCTSLVSMATLSIAFAGYLKALLPVIPTWALVLALFAGLTFFNFRGMAESSALNIICTTLEVSGLIIVILVSTAFLLSGHESQPPTMIPDGSMIGPVAILQGATLAFYAFIGFEDIVNVAEEVKRPQQTVPKAILLSLAFAGVLYILVSWLATQVLPPEELSASAAPLLDVVLGAQPGFPAVVFTVIALFAVLNTALLNFITASRLLYGMSRERLLPKWLGKLHPERRTPHRTFLVILPVAIVLALSGTLQFLAGTTATMLLLMFCLVNVSLLIVQRRQPLNPGGLRIPGLVPVFALLSNLLLIGFASSASHLLALAFVVIGLVLIGVHQTIAGRAEKH